MVGTRYLVLARANPQLSLELSNLKMIRRAINTKSSVTCLNIGSSPDRIPSSSHCLGSLVLIRRYHDAPNTSRTQFIEAFGLENRGTLPAIVSRDCGNLMYLLGPEKGRDGAVIDSPGRPRTRGRSGSSQHGMRSTQIGPDSGWCITCC